MRVDPARVLEEIKRLVVEQLGSLPGTLYAAVEEGLRLAVALAPIDAAHNPYEDQAALWVLRQHHATHVMRYRQQLAAAFDARLVITPRATLGSMDLVSEQELDVRLAAQRAAEPIENTHKLAVDALNARFAILARSVGRPERDSNPIAPLALVEALMAIFSDELVPDTLRDQLLKQYEIALGPLLPELYARAGAVLAEQGYGDPMRRVQAPGMPPIAPTPQATRREEPMAPSARPEPRRDVPSQAGHVPPPAFERDMRFESPLFDQVPHRPAPMVDSVTAQEVDELRDLLRVWRQSATHAPAAPSPASRAPSTPQAPARELRIDEVVSVASLLQGEPADTFSRALVGTGRLADTIRDELRDGTRRLGLMPEQTRFSAIEDDSIDLVAMLFDTLFHNHRMVDRARRVYGRLVLPMVKVALNDPSLFVRDAHPARRLLEAVTEACAGNAGETSQERELLDRAAAAAQRVVAEYNEDIAVFDLARNELDTLLQQQRRRIDLQEERAAKATFGRERLQRAREQADAILARRLAAPPVSREVGEFLTTSWRHQLVQAFLRDGGAPPADAVSLGDALVAADRAAAAGRGRELADRLLAIEPAIMACLASSGLDDSAARHSVATLVKSLVDPDVERDLKAAPVEENADDVAEAALWFADADATPVKPAHGERIGQLKVGDWMQVTNLQGEAVSAKVAWISPMTSRRLLVNRRGVRVLVASVEQLAQLAGEGRLDIVDERAAVDEAMQQVRQRLHAGIALH